MNQTPVLGCIADDFTGASDLASFLVKGGMTTLQTSGVPDRPLQEPAQALVVALKTRTSSVEQAVKDSLGAVAWLREQGCTRFYFKYCSTFDSTPAGNIGPVIDAMLEHLNLVHALVCPALPQNGRTVYQGHLFVDDQLLENSPLRDHPLTPMRESRLSDILAPQVEEKHRAHIRLAPFGELEQITADNTARYLIADAVTPSDLSQLARVFGPDERWMLTGGSGLGEWLGAALDVKVDSEASGLASTRNRPDLKAPRILCLAGSCSASTRAQVERAGKILPTLSLDTDSILAGTYTVSNVREWLARHSAQSVLVSTSSPPETVSFLQSRYGKEKVSSCLESFLAEVAVTPGFDALVVAGGETSGAVVQAMECDQLRVGPSVCPGVPVMQEVDGKERQIVLKSGNFGDADFFQSACELIQ